RDDPCCVEEVLDGQPHPVGDGRRTREKDAVGHIPDMRIADLNWLQAEEYLTRDDRIVLPLGSTEQHAYLSLATANLLAERVAVEAAEPVGVPVLPVLPYGVAPAFVAYPGTVSLPVRTLLTVVRDVLDALYAQGFRRVLVVNGHGGNTPARTAAQEWAAERAGAQAIHHD